MPPSSHVRIPANVEKEDQVLLSLTARQLAILTVAATLAGGVLWLIHSLLPALPLPVLGMLGLPLLAGGAVLALGQRDGIGLDRLAWAALQHARAPHTLTPAPAPDPAPSPHNAGLREHLAGLLPAPSGLPVRRVTPQGLVDLGPEGQALVCAATPVNFTLRTPEEQAALLAVMARLLHTMIGPTQILIRTRPADLQPTIDRLTQQATRLPHPAMQAAAHQHAEFLHALDTRREVLARQVFVVFRRPAQLANRSEAAVVLRRQAQDAAAVLATAAITLTPLTRPQVIHMLGLAAPAPEVPPSADDDLPVTATCRRTA